MRRDQLEPGALYLGSDKKCYEVIDLEPGWRIGFDLDWIRDDSTRQRTMHGKKVSFRKNNAVRAIVHVGPTQQVKAVVLPSRLLRLWDDRLVAREKADVALAESLVKEIIRLAQWARPSRKVTDHAILDGGTIIKLHVEDVKTLLVLIPQLSPNLELFPEPEESTLESG